MRHNVGWASQYKNGDGIKKSERLHRNNFCVVEKA